MGLVKASSPNLVQPTSAEQISTPEITTAKKDTFHNRTAIAPNAYPDVYGTLLTYTSGVGVAVEYFKRREPYIANQATDTSFSLERGSVHTSYDLIHNFEIKIQDEGIQIDVDDESNETRITGVAVIYPGFLPNPGDLFYFRLPENQIGVFIVDRTKPLSIQRGSHYEVSFHIVSYLDDETDQKLRASVVDELWFDKKTYFSGEVTLLSDKSYKQLARLLELKKQMIGYLTTKFYLKESQTLIRPDKVFDSYIVEMVSEMVSVTELRKDVTQLAMTYVDAFQHSIWSTILNQDVTQLAYTGYLLHAYKNYVWDSSITPMDDQPVVTIVESQDVIKTHRLFPLKFEEDSEVRVVSYHFSDRFYFTLLKSFESGVLVDDVVPFLPELGDYPRVFPNLVSTFYSLTDNQYHDLAYFDTHNRATGSNNDRHLPELEELVFQYIYFNEVDVEYLVEKALAKFPWPNMRELDQFYYIPVMIHLINVAIQRIR